MVITRNVSATMREINHYHNSMYADYSASIFHTLKPDGSRVVPNIHEPVYLHTIGRETRFSNTILQVSSDGSRHLPSSALHYDFAGVLDTSLHDRVREPFVIKEFNLSNIDRATKRAKLGMPKDLVQMYDAGIFTDMEGASPEHMLRYNSADAGAPVLRIAPNITGIDARSRRLLLATNHMINFIPSLFNQDVRVIEREINNHPRKDVTMFGDLLARIEGTIQDRIDPSNTSPRVYSRIIGTHEAVWDKHKPSERRYGDAFTSMIEAIERNERSMNIADCMIYLLTAPLVPTVTITNAGISASRNMKEKCEDAIYMFRPGGASAPQPANTNGGFVQPPSNDGGGMAEPCEPVDPHDRFTMVGPKTSLFPSEGLDARGQKFMAEGGQVYETFTSIKLLSDEQIQFLSGYIDFKLTQGYSGDIKAIESAVAYVAQTSDVTHLLEIMGRDSLMGNPIFADRVNYVLTQNAKLLTAAEYASARE